MATQLLPDETGFGLRPRPLALASTSLGAAPQPAAGSVIGRRPPVNMGMADVVPPAQLPAPQAASAVQVATPAAAPAPSADLIGRRAPINMGAADVVQPARVATASAPAALAAPEAAAARIPVARAVGGAGVALGVGVEGKQVYDVANNPGATGIDVAAQTAQGVGRLSAAGAGAGAGAAAGSVLGPVGTAVGGVVGGGLGYFAADRAIAAGRSALGSDPRSPAEQLAAAAPAVAAPPTESGGAAFGIYPRPSSQFSTNANDAALQRGVQATGPSTFVPATPAVAAAPAPAQRLNNLTDPRSTQFQGGVGAAASAAPAPVYSEPLSDGNTSYGVVPAAAAPAPDSGLPLGVARSGNSFSGANVGSPAGAAPGTLGGLEDTNARLARLQASNAAVPQGGLTVIDNPGPAAAQAMFDGAALRTTLARGAPPGRNGAQVFAQQVEAAQNPIQQRNALAAQATKDAGETQRALIQERGVDARTRAQTAQQQEANSIDRARLGIDAIRAGNAGVPTGYRVKADGTGLEPIPGGPQDPNTPKGKNTLNDTQAKALQFGSRMQASEGILDRLATAGVDQPGLVKRGADAIGLGAAANWTQSAEQQQVEQAQRDFINAALRRESGAAIADSEFSNARQQYFPQPGDSKEVRAQKKQNRELATRGILAEVPDSEKRLAQVREPGATAAAPAAAMPPGMSKQVGTSGGKPVYEDAQGRRFIGG